jgi:hypothetical protein
MRAAEGIWQDRLNSLVHKHELQGDLGDADWACLRMKELAKEYRKFPENTKYLLRILELVKKSCSC